MCTIPNVLPNSDHHQAIMTDMLSEIIRNELGRQVSMKTIAINTAASSASNTNAGSCSLHQRILRIRFFQMTENRR